MKEIKRCNVCKTSEAAYRNVCFKCELELALRRNTPSSGLITGKLPISSPETPPLPSDLVRLPVDPAKTFVAVITGERGTGMSVPSSLLSGASDLYNMAALRAGGAFKKAGSEESGGCTKCEIKE